MKDTFKISTSCIIYAHNQPTPTSLIGLPWRSVHFLPSHILLVQSRLTRGRPGRSNAKATRITDAWLSLHSEAFLLPLYKRPVSPQDCQGTTGTRVEGKGREEAGRVDIKEGDERELGAGGEEERDGDEWAWAQREEEREPR